MVKNEIALARSFIRKPKIAVFDEPTNSLDGETEILMKDYIDKNYIGKTLILATHKISLLSIVDRIIVIAGGKVVADGPKDSVLKQMQQPS